MWELFTGLGQPCAGILIVKVSCKWLSHLHRNEKHPPHVRGIIAWGLFFLSERKDFVHQKER